MTAAKPPHYLAAYQPFWPARPFTLLEIGVHTGGSMRLWRAWFPESVIVGLDHDISQTAPIEGVHLREGDQSDPAVLEALVAEFGGFDVVIDDGSHIWDHQQLAFAHLWPYTRRWYAIEDLETCYPGLIRPDHSEWAHGRNTMDWLHDWVDNVHESGGSPIHFWPGLALIER